MGLNAQHSFWHQTYCKMLQFPHILNAGTVMCKLLDLQLIICTAFYYIYTTSLRNSKINASYCSCTWVWQSYV